MGEDVDRSYGVRFTFDPDNAGPGQWLQESLFGLTSEVAARHFYESAIEHPHMRDVELLHGDDVLERHL